MIRIISLWSMKVPILGIAYEVKYNALFKNHVRLPFSPFVRDLVSATKLSVSFNKILCGFFTYKLSRMRGFCENQWVRWKAAQGQP
jgi:hypothetical protein